jgi:hypothetical protein
VPEEQDDRVQPARRDSPDLRCRGTRAVPASAPPAAGGSLVPIREGRCPADDSTQNLMRAYLSRVTTSLPGLHRTWPSATRAQQSMNSRAARSSVMCASAGACRRSLTSIRQLDVRVLDADQLRFVTCRVACCGPVGGCQNMVLIPGAGSGIIKTWKPGARPPDPPIRPRAHRGPPRASSPVQLGGEEIHDIRTRKNRHDEADVGKPRTAHDRRGHRLDQSPRADGAAASRGL